MKPDDRVAATALARRAEVVAAALGLIKRRNKLTSSVVSVTIKQDVEPTGRPVGIFLATIEEQSCVSELLACLTAARPLFSIF
jgi:hypothetical protein